MWSVAVGRYGGLDEGAGRKRRGFSLKSGHVLGLLILLSLCLLWPGQLQAQTEEGSAVAVEAASSEVDYAFGQVMHFRLQVEEVEAVESVTLFFRVPEFPNTFTVNIPVTLSDHIDVEHAVDLSQIRLAPFTTVTYWWLLTMGAGEEMVVPEQTIVYEDDRFAWRQLNQDGFNVYWTGEDPALGRLALDVLVETMPRLEAIIPVTEMPAFQLYVYPTSADLRTALRLTGRDWVGAHAHPELGVMLVTAVNARTAAVDLRHSIPHEMVHFLLYQVTGPSYDTLPLWFNEGLATYLEEIPNPNYEVILETAVADGTTIPFAELCRTFPEAEDRALLAYAQSVSMVRFIQARYGNQALSKMVSTFADGADCYSGVSRSLEVSLGELNQAWLRDQQPRAPLVQFLRRNGLWLLLLLASIGISGLLVVNPKAESS